MLIGVISDTHDRLPLVERALEHFNAVGVGLIIHCGDWKLPATARHFAELTDRYNQEVYGVLGNNDLDIDTFLALNSPRFHLQAGVLQLTVADGARITAYHGHHALTLRRVMEQYDTEIILLGHTHKPLISNQNGSLIVNPGSTAFAIPRRHGWQPTIAIVDTETLMAELVELSS